MSLPMILYLVFWWECLTMAHLLFRKSLWMHQAEFNHSDVGQTGADWWYHDTNPFCIPASGDQVMVAQMSLALKHMKSQPIAYPQVNVSLEAMTYAAKSCKLAKNLWYNSRYWTKIPMYQFQVSPNINFADASVKSLLLHGVVMVAGCPRPATCCSAPSARIFKASSPLLLGTDREPP